MRHDPAGPRPRALAVRGVARAAVLAGALAALSGCSPLYVLRAGYEEMRILWRREPIEQVLAREADAELRQKLELTLAVRAFAREHLGLAVGGSYSSVARVDEDQVVHVVTAAPWDRLELHTWWFPIVGRVPYRGYFDRSDAEKLAADLAAEGYDTNVRPSVAFSTLGWFDDPLLSNLLRYDAGTLSNIIVHELLHNTMYLPGQAAFNESFASFVGCRGAVEFFRRRGDESAAQRELLRCGDEMTFSRFLGGLVDRLSAAYRAGIGRAERDELLAAAQAEFRAESWQTDLYTRFGKAPLDNAVILHRWLYARRLDLFAIVFDRYEGDLRRTIEWVVATAKTASDPWAAIEEGLGRPPEETVAVHPPKVRE